MQLVTGVSCVHRAAPRVRLLGARRCLLDPPSCGRLPHLWEGPEETHHLTGGEAESLMAKREGETKRGVRAAGSPNPPPLCPAPKTLRAGRWPSQCLSPVPARRCPSLPHPHPKEAEGLLHPDPWVLHRELTHHGAMCGLQPRSSGGSWYSALPAGGVPSPLVGMRRRVVSRVPLGGAGAQASRALGPCPRSPPPWLSPARGQEPGYLAGGRGSVKFGGRHGPGEGSATGATQRWAEAAPLYIEAPGACPVPGRRRGPVGHRPPRDPPRPSRRNPPPVRRSGVPGVENIRPARGQRETEGQTGPGRQRRS